MRVIERIYERIYIIEAMGGPTKKYEFMKKHLGITDKKDAQIFLVRYNNYILSIRNDVEMMRKWEKEYNRGIEKQGKIK